MSKKNPNKVSISKLTVFVFGYLRPHALYWTALMFLSFILIGFSLVDPLILKFLLDEVLVGGNSNVLLPIMLLFTLLKVLAIAASYFFTLGYTELSQRIFVAIRNDLFEHLQYKKMNYFNKKEVGGLIRALITDVQQMIQVIRVTEGLITNVVRLTITLVIILGFDWRLALLGVLAIPVYSMIQFFYVKKISSQVSSFVLADVTLFNFFEERLSNILLVKLFSKEKREAAKSKRLMENQAQEIVKLTSVTLGMSSLIGLVSTAAVVIALWAGSYSVIQGTLTIGALLAIYTYIGQLFSPISSIISTPSNLQGTLVAAKRIFDIMDAPEEMTVKGLEKNVSKLNGKIEFRNIGFAYPDRKNITIYKNLNFTINPGETVGIVGGSGVGKSTIIRLLLRFYDPQAGIIYIDGIPINTIRRKSLREHIGVVPQDNLFLPGSVRENIIYSKETASKELIFEAAKSTNIHEQIQKLTEGYETTLGPRGTPFSGGERQRLSIARVIIKDPDIFIFDEATSDVDARSEDIIRKSIKGLAKGRTSIIIAHRFSTLKYVDRVLVIKDGGVVEDGTVKQLMKKKGEFYHLSKLQSEEA